MEGVRVTKNIVTLGGFFIVVVTHLLPVYGSGLEIIMLWRGWHWKPPEERGTSSGSRKLEEKCAHVAMLVAEYRRNPSDFVLF